MSGNVCCLPQCPCEGLRVPLGLLLSGSPWYLPQLLLLNSQGQPLTPIKHGPRHKQEVP